jgi:hypothetical protein
METETLLLHLACRRDGNSDHIILLIERDPSLLRIVNNKMPIALHLACINYHVPMETLRLMYKHIWPVPSLLLGEDAEMEIERQLLPYRYGFAVAGEREAEVVDLMTNANT